VKNRFQRLPFKCNLQRYNAGHDDDAAADYGVKQTHKAFNPEDGLEMIIDADDACVLRGGCERVLLTRCPPRDSNVVGLCRLKQVDP
jgi:hypothetical protein